MIDSLGLEVWHIWLIAACIVAAIELLLLSSYYLLAVAGGLALTGIATAILAVSLSMQWFVFALGTVITALTMRYFRAPKDKEIADDASYMIGKQVEVVERVSPRGRVLYKGVTWAAESEDSFEKGETARIQHVNGSTLYIEKVEVKS